MRYHAIACDYDGTLAHDGAIDEATLAALGRLRATGRKLLMVTGRELDDLMRVCPHLHLFDLVVAENGALIYRPSDGDTRLLAEPPPPEFVAELRKRGVGPISVGRSIVATWVPHETAVLDVIHRQGLEMQVIFNKDAVMVLPSGVNKASGLRAALTDLHLSAHEVAGVGDAENDHAFLSICECAVAVANALPAIKDRADWVTRGHHGAGVTELIEAVIADDLAPLRKRLKRHYLPLGRSEANTDVSLAPDARGVLICGPSGSGKSTAASALLERLTEHGYQFCIIDPEGDYEGMEGAFTCGGKTPPSADEVMGLLEVPANSVIVNMIGVPLADRPPFFLSLLPRLLAMRGKTGRPHWIVLDEAHHLLPASWQPGRIAFPAEMDRVVFITVHPDQVAAEALAHVSTVIAVGKPRETLVQFAEAAGHSVPPDVPEAVEDGEVVVWSDAGTAVRVKLKPATAQRRRHVRKYAEGELPPDRSFWFTGPEKKLKLRAQNLFLFLQIAEGVDDATWSWHLQQGDVSRWFREAIKDEELAAEAERIEQEGLDAAGSREAIKGEVGKRYTLPATAPLPMPGTAAAPEGEE